MRWFWIGIEALRYYWACLPKNHDSGMPSSLIPDATYLEWRVDTAYGSIEKPDGTPRPRPPQQFMLRDIITFLEWRRRMRVTQKLKPRGPHPVAGDDRR